MCQALIKQTIKQSLFTHMQNKYKMAYEQNGMLQGYKKLQRWRIQRNLGRNELMESKGEQREKDT